MLTIEELQENICILLVMVTDLNVDQALWGKLQELSRLSHAAPQLHKVCADLGITPTAAKVLRAISVAGTLSMGDLAHSFSCDPSNITALVDTLEREALVERGAHPTDRRVKQVRLTEKGNHAFQLLTQADAVIPATVERLNPSEKRTLLQLLDKLSATSPMTGESPSAS